MFSNGVLIDFPPSADSRWGGQVAVSAVLANTGVVAYCGHGLLIFHTLRYCSVAVRCVPVSSGVGGGVVVICSAHCFHTLRYCSVAVRCVPVSSGVGGGGGDLFRSLFSRHC